MIKQIDHSSILRVSRPPQNDTDSYYENLHFHTQYMIHDFDNSVHERYYGHGYNTSRTSNYSDSENETSDYENFDFDAQYEIDDFFNGHGCNASYSKSENNG